MATLKSFQAVGKVLCQGMAAFTFIAFATSCEKEELPVPAFDRGDVDTVYIGMGETYDTQVWFDLSTQSVVKTGSRFDWDFAFDASDSANWVYLNSAVGMVVAASGEQDFEAVQSHKGLSYRPDHPSGLKDSLGLGRWWESNEVWVIDLGYTSEGKSRGFRKIQFELKEGGVLHFRLASLNGNNEQTGEIEKNDLYNRVGYSITNAGIVFFEPAKTEYDLFFTRYHQIFYEPYLPYLVNGVLLNPYGTTGTKAFDREFTALTADHLSDYVFTDSADVIGYDWKNFDLNTQVYSVFPEFCYLVQDEEGFYHKLRFIDFYKESTDENGNKTRLVGYPLMEFQAL